MHAAIPDLDDLVHRHIQKIAVVRDQHEGERIIGQVLLQPVARFQIQVIGRLVEQQQVRLFEQQLGQRDAHLPAARKFFGAPVPFRVRKPKPREHRSNLRLDGISIARAKFAIQLMKTIGHLRVFRARGIELRHLVRQVFHLLLHFAQRSEHRHALGENAAAGKREPVLRQVAGADAARDAEAAVFERFECRARILSSVVLPVPLAPTRPARSFDVISQFRFSNRSLWPKRLPAPESWIIAFLASSFSCLVANVEGVWKKRVTEPRP